VITVRQEARKDFARISEVVEAAFGKPVEARLVERIRASAEYVPELSLVAEKDGEIVGHVMYSYSMLTDGDERRRVLQLAPLAVSPERQGEGIGGLLVRASLALADERGEPLVVLLGHPTYYPRFGFEPASEYGIEPPDGRQRPAFMIARLSKYDGRYRGLVAFAPAFDET
jgi:putative acetyltransferase